MATEKPTQEDVGADCERKARIFVREALEEISVGRIQRAREILEHAAYALAPKSKRRTRGAA